MKFLSVAGTLAMFLVGGHIFVANIPVLHHAVEAWTQGLGAAAGVIASLLEALIGAVAGLVVLLAVEGFKKLRA